VHGDGFATHPRAFPLIFSSGLSNMRPNVPRGAVAFTCDPDGSIIPVADGMASKTKQ
jgi:hypothetical protein